MVVMLQQFPGYKRDTGLAVGVEAVPLLQNHYRVPHVALYEVDTEVGARHRPPLEEPHWTPYEPGNIGK